jgi:hypothetical protein
MAKTLGLTMVVVLMLGVLPLDARDEHHYVFTLPSGYVGWIQVVFGDRGAPPLSYKKKEFRIAIDHSGLFRTQTLHVVFGGKNEFFYRENESRGRREELVRVPDDYLLDLMYEGGFSVGGAGDMTVGSSGCTSWFFSSALLKCGRRHLSQTHDGKRERARCQFRPSIRCQEGCNCDETAMKPLGAVI